MPVLTPQEEDLLVQQVIQLIRNSTPKPAVLSIQKILQKLQNQLRNFIENYEP